MVTLMSPNLLGPPNLMAPHLLGPPSLMDWEDYDPDNAPPPGESGFTFSIWDGDVVPADSKEGKEAVANGVPVYQTAAEALAKWAGIICKAVPSLCAGQPGGQPPPRGPGTSSGEWYSTTGGMVGIAVGVLGILGLGYLAFR